MNLLSALLGAVLGAVVAGLVSVRAAARHWHRDRVLEAWTNVIDELAVLTTSLPPIDPTAVANAEDVRDQVERQLHAQVMSLGRRRSVLGLLGDDQGCALLTDVQDSLWDVAFLIMPGSTQGADHDQRRNAIGDSLSRVFEDAESASTALAHRGRGRVAAWITWIPGRPRSPID
jgi:hypothetical protein